MISGVRLDKGFVVPYNRELLLLYKAHINVEICCQSRLMKYLFKYFNKGPDRIRASIEKKDGDEIMAHLNCRFIGPYEAAWRLSEFSIYFREPTILRLEMHLTNLNNVVFNTFSKLTSILSKPDITKIMFIEWFELNKHDIDARRLTYSQIPSKYVWNFDCKVWTKRIRGKRIGRVGYVNPAAGDLYYMRIPLNIVKEPQSFEELRTVKGTLFHNFKEACYALGLLGDHKEWNEALDEAEAFASAVEIRQLFVTTVMYYGVANPLTLLESHWHSMADDILHKLRQ